MSQALAPCDPCISYPISVRSCLQRAKPCGESRDIACIFRIELLNQSPRIISAFHRHRREGCRKKQGLQRGHMVLVFFSVFALRLETRPFKTLTILSISLSRRHYGALAICFRIYSKMLLVRQRKSQHDIMDCIPNKTRPY